MRYFCVVVLLAWIVGSADVFVAGQQQSVGGRGGTRQSTRPPAQPQADVPKEFGFLFQSTDQRIRDIAQRGVMTYLEDLWKGLPYDSISLERGGTGGCIVACAYSGVTLYRATVPGMGVVGAAPCRTAPCTVPGDLRGRAELRTVAAPNLALAGLINVQPPAPQPGQLEQVIQPQIGPIISDFEGSVDVYTFANLSYLLYRARFLQLPDEYPCRSCPADRFYIALSVAAGGKTKTVVDFGEGRPIELWAIQQALDSITGTSAHPQSIKWTKK